MFSPCFDDWIRSSPLIVFLFDCFKISDRFYESMKTDLGRLRREFYTPEPISLTGNYYPRYTNTQHPPLPPLPPNYSRLFQIQNYRFNGDWELPCVLPCQTLLFLRCSQQIRILKVGPDSLGGIYK